MRLGLDKCFFKIDIQEESLILSDSRVFDPREFKRELFIETDPAGVLTFVGDDVGQLLGWRPEEMLGKPISEFSVDDAGHNDLEILKIIAKQQPFRVPRNKMRHKNGSTVVFETCSVPHFDANNQFAGCSMVSLPYSGRE